MADGCTNRILSREFFSKNWTTIVKTMVENYGRQVRFHLRAASLKSPSTYHWPSLESRFVFIDRLFIHVCRRIRSEVVNAFTKTSRRSSRILSYSRVKNPRGATLSPLLLLPLFSRAWKRRRTGYLRLPLPREHANTFTPRCATLDESTRRVCPPRVLPFFPFFAGGPFTEAARFAQVAFEVGSRPMESAKDWFPASPSTPASYYGCTPNHVFSFLLRSFLRRSSSFLYDGVCCDTNTKRTLGFNWLLSLTRVYLYMYICVCMYTYVYIYIVCTIYENRRDFIVCA